MPHQPDEADPNQWHRYFAMEGNNRAWAVGVRDHFAARDTADWEMAFAHTIVAHAAAVAGRTPLHKAAYAQAVAALDTIADAEDRRIVALTFDQVPIPE